MCRTIGIIAAIGLALAACAEDAPAVDPPGAPETAKTKALETGARVLQQSGPAAQLDVHLVGFHPLKDEPSQQLISHHYCEVVNEELVQCALFDSNSDEANLHGVEHIISSRLFESLPPEEQAYWHPHNYEILSGQLVALGLPPAAEQALMKRLMNSYGKTWHVWDTGMSPDRLPQGEAELAWSFNADNELDPQLLEQRDRTLNVDTQEVRKARQSLIPLARPQRGVDVLAEHFPNRQQPEWIEDLDDDDDME